MDERGFNITSTLQYEPISVKCISYKRLRLEPAFVHIISIIWVYETKYAASFKIGEWRNQI